MRSPIARFCIVASRFNREITEALLKGSLEVFRAHRIPRSAVDLVWVPGAFELPVAALRMALSGRYRAIVAVGCILAGETPQFAYLSQAAYQGLSLAGVLSGIPVTSGVVTARRREHARARAKHKGLNRGREAAEAALEMVKTLEKIRIPL